MTFRFDTRAVHAGLDPDEPAGAITPPIYLSSTYRMAEVDSARAGYEYARVGNPTREGLERALADLEGGYAGMAFSSGVAAADAVFRALCRPGDHVVVPRTMYGGTVRLSEGLHSAWGVSVTPVPVRDPEAFRTALRPDTRLIWLESPGNPLLEVTDIAAVAELAHHSEIPVAVDSTFATPYLMRPLSLGADVVVHSTTKYLGGHSDVVGGAVVTSLPDLADAVRAVQIQAGAVAAPFDSWLVMRGLRTLPLRMRRHCESALAVARWLDEHHGVAEVIYPGLADHPDHGLATGLMRTGGVVGQGSPAYGGIVSFRVRGGSEAAREVCRRVRLIALGGSLGGVESLLGYPTLMSHGVLAGTDRELPGDLLRLSVGLEDVDDLLEDLAQALYGT